ncbi:hypothetical protein FHS57_001243 [Runella defluvii]|uniref:Uncharacterized protein n=1 Tax=Runella defluvii TaxID=370973 RepID=A0A7W5ZI11_9BACT|nr:hypothetical protein [Runella defluvii]
MTRSSNFKIPAFLQTGGKAQGVTYFYKANLIVSRSYKASSNLLE